jgi:hypothetical protein
MAINIQRLPGPVTLGALSATWRLFAGPHRPPARARVRVAAPVSDEERPRRERTGQGEEWCSPKMMALVHGGIGLP